VEYLVGITLLQGGESLLADRAISQVIAKFKGATVIAFDASELELGGITDALAPSLFGDSRIIVIKEIQDLPAELGEEITAYLEAQDESVELVLWHKGGVKGKALLEKIKKAKPTVIPCNVIKKDGEKSDFIRAEFKRLGRPISTEAVQALIDALGSDLRELGGACSQLAADVTRDVALISLRNALATGTDPVLITSALAGSLRTLAKVSGASRGVKSFDLAGPLGLAPWQIDKARRQLSKWTPATLAGAVVAVAQADADIKGAAVDPIHSLERAIIAITSRV
jgi:DNA polymerase-3 subunit delta